MQTDPIAEMRTDSVVAFPRLRDATNFDGSRLSSEIGLSKRYAGVTQIAGRLN